MQRTVLLSRIGFSCCVSSSLFAISLFSSGGSCAAATTTPTARIAASAGFIVPGSSTTTSNTPSRTFATGNFGSSLGYLVKASPIPDKTASPIICPSTSASSRLFSGSSSSSSTTATEGRESMSSSFQVVQFPCLGDNYGYLIHDETTGQTAAVDTPDAKPYIQELEKRGWKLTHILNTHHHYDHTGGNLALKERYADAGVKVVGPVNEQSKIPGIDVAVGGGDTVEFGSPSSSSEAAITVIDVGGHTKGHIAYYFPNENKVFVGDSLFALGCGKMFEGTPEQFWSSLLRLRDLPDATTVYCAHEYTASNAKFAASVEPNNVELMTRIKEILALRAEDQPTVPSVLGTEKRTNPFLRVDVSEEIRANVGVSSTDSDANAFAKLRRAKDNFRG